MVVVCSNEEDGGWRAPRKRMATVCSEDEDDIYVF
jgi:hypothetical protein